MYRCVITVMLIVCALAGTAAAQKDTSTVWKKSLDFGFAIAQTAYSDSWAGGEAGNASWVANLNSIFEGPLGQLLVSKSTFKFSFGQTHVQDAETKSWKSPTKSTDLIDLESVLRYNSGWYVNPYFGLRFESQFLDATVPTIKRYVNPFKLTESAGFTRRMFQRDKEFIDSRIGFAMREFFDRQIVYGTDSTTHTFKTNSTTDGGLESVTDVSLKVHKNILWTSKLSLYKALSVSDKSAMFWPSVDINWENIFSASVTKYVVVNLYTQWLYDKQIDKRGRFKETLSLGLTYKLL